MRVQGFVCVAVVAVVAGALGVGGCGGAVVGGDLDAGADGSAPGDAAPGDAGLACTPLSGCTSTTDCPSPGGCGTCLCSEGKWECTFGCRIDAGPPPCPTTPPPSGAACAWNGQQCGGFPQEICGPFCTCESGAWSCVYPPCVALPCPQAPPFNTSCKGYGGRQCDYPNANACGGAYCSCPAGSGTWSCVTAGCVDAGGPPPMDAGN